MSPLISAFCDGEAGPKQVAELREHLRACAHCRATLRAYRAAPAAALALAPGLPLQRSIWERAHDTLSELCGRFGGGRGEAASQVAAGGSGSAGAAALAKVAIVCIGTAGGAAACVATGLVPAPLDLTGEPERSAGLERQLNDEPPPQASVPRVDYAPAPEPKPKSTPDRPPPPDEAPAESAPVATEPPPATSGSEVEHAPPPTSEPTAEPAPGPSSGNGSPAGEFGP